jgi:hypothetical protein
MLLTRSKRELLPPCKLPVIGNNIKLLILPFLLSQAVLGSVTRPYYASSRQESAEWDESSDFFIWSRGSQILGIPPSAGSNGTDSTETEELYVQQSTASAPDEQTRLEKLKNETKHQAKKLLPSEMGHSGEKSSRLEIFSVCHQRSSM